MSKRTIIDDSYVVRQTQDTMTNRSDEKKDLRALFYVQQESSFQYHPHHPQTVDNNCVETQHVPSHISNGGKRQHGVDPPESVCMLHILPPKLKRWFAVVVLHMAMVEDVSEISQDRTL